jgi:glycosyltransferase involved in cell wall biosynthesis
MKNKVAIIIPTYNRPEYLKRCLDSLQKTFLENKTLIYIIDDGSEDETKFIIKNFRKKGCVIRRVLKKENNGIYDSLLIAYEYCFNLNYEYVIKLDADMIVNNYFYDMMIYYKKIFPNNIISGFNTLTTLKNGTVRHPILYDGKFYIKKKTSGGACIGIDKNIYDKYIKNTLMSQKNNNKLCYDTISTEIASNDGFFVICTVPSVAEHIGIVSSLGHDENPDASVDFREYIEL